MTEEQKTLSSLVSAQHAQAAPLFELCLDNDDILAFAQGKLEGEDLERMHVHVDACEVCQRLVAEAVHALDSAPISESARPSWNTVFQSNSMIGKRYRILRLVARGGMGEVYEAYDTALHERVALKTVTSTNCDSAQAVKCLKAEVQLARRITHPNVCRIYDLGTHVMEPSGAEIHFLVMEFVEGECLGQLLRKLGVLPLELAQSIAHQLLLGLRAAHDAGILHRDFKSDNVMLRSESNGRVTPVILDFGLAKALNESGTIAITQAQGQTIVGTIGYMAPEQIEGVPLSMASDLYAFGVVWFEMITGRLPFDCDTPAASAMARLHRAPPVPSSLNPQVPRWLDDIILQCLRRHRAERFATAEQVLDALACKRQGSPVRSGMPSRIRLYRPVLAMLLVLGVGVVALLMRRAQSVVTPSVELTVSRGLVVQAKPPAAKLGPKSLDETGNGRSADAPPRPMLTKTKEAIPQTNADRRVARHAKSPTKTAPAATTALQPEKAPDWLPIWPTEKGAVLEPQAIGDGRAVSEHNH